MSLNIPQKILDVSSKVTVEIDLEKLGPRQKTSLVKMVRTGHIAGDGVPAQLALSIRKTYGAEVAKTTRGWYGNSSVEVSNGTDELKQALRVALVASKLDPTSKFYSASSQHKHWYGTQAIDNDAEVLADDYTKRNYDVLTLSSSTLKLVTKHKLNTPQAVLDVANNIETGVTKTFSLNYN